MTPVTLHFRGLMACVAYFGSVRSFVRFGHGTFTGPDPVQGGYGWQRYSEGAMSFASLYL